MYTSILQITDNKKTASRILLQVIISLKTAKFTGISLIACLLKSTNLVAANYLEANKATVFQTLVDLSTPPPQFCNLPGVRTMRYAVWGAV